MNPPPPTCDVNPLDCRLNALDPRRGSAERGPMAPTMWPKRGWRREKIWRWMLWVFDPCNPLKSQKTAKAFFGNPWRKTSEIWKSLQKSFGGRHHSARFHPSAWKLAGQLWKGNDDGGRKSVRRHSRG